MKLILILLIKGVVFFWPVVAISAEKAPAEELAEVSPRKKLVCSITINSSDEIEVFKEQLSTEEFDFVELAPLDQKTSSMNTHWFHQVCKEDLKCDVLLISGHFAGVFFGESNNYILPSALMEKKACSQECAGILSHPTEVFLFGCNTLAGKEQDERSPEEYLQVLMDHGMARDMAERVASVRYLPYGMSFEEQMQMVFAGENTRLYGFNSLSPLGRQIRKPLQKYLEEMKKDYGSYSLYLETTKGDLSSKSYFPYHIKNSAVVSQSLQMDSAHYSQFGNICRLYDQKTRPNEGMRIVQKIMEGGSGLKAFSAIKYFIEKNQQAVNKHSVFQHLSKNQKVREDFYNVYDQISGRLPYIKIQYLNFLNIFGWPKPEFYETELKSHLLSMIQPPSAGGYDSVRALMEDNFMDRDLGRAVGDLPPDFYSNVWSPLIAEALDLKNYLVHRRLMNLCLSMSEDEFVVCYQVLKSLGHLDVDDSLVVDRMRMILNNVRDPGLIYYSLYGLAYAGAADPEVHKAMAVHLEHSDPWVRLQAVRSFAFLKVTDSENHRKLLKLLARAEELEIIHDILMFFNTVALEAHVLKELQQVILNKNLNQHSNSEIQSLAQSF